MENEPYQQEDKAYEWTVFRCGIAGIYGLGVMSGLKFLAAIPRLFTEDWTWTELLLFPIQVIVLGFLSGATTGLLLPLARFGRIGHAIVGAGCANVYLLVCFAMFETQALLHPRLESVLAFAMIASLLGSAMGIYIAKNIADAKNEADG